jgi:hypothetical protein
MYPIQIRGAVFPDYASRGMILCMGLSRRDSALLTVCFSLRTGDEVYIQVPQGRHFINRMLQLTVRQLTEGQLTDGQSTLRPQVPQGRHNQSAIRMGRPCGTWVHTSSPVRKLKHTVNKVLSLRDRPMHKIMPREVYILFRM